MRYLFQIILFSQIILISCEKEKPNNVKVEKQNIIEESDTKASKSKIETTETASNEPGESIKIRKYAQMILDNKIQPSDNEETFEVIDQLFIENQNEIDFYFEVFRVIVDKSDGALSEVIGLNIMRFLKSNPDFFISKYIEFVPAEKTKYIFQMAFEFYFVDDNYETEINNYFSEVTISLENKSRPQIEILEGMRKNVLTETKRMLQE